MARLLKLFTCALACVGLAVVLSMPQVSDGMKRLWGLATETGRTFAARASTTHWPSRTGDAAAEIGGLSVYTESEDAKTGGTASVAQSVARGFSHGKPAPEINMDARRERALKIYADAERRAANLGAGK